MKVQKCEDNLVVTLTPTLSRRTGRGSWCKKLAARAATIYSEIMKKHAGIAALLAIALVLRLTWGFIHGEQIDARLPDQNEYLQLAENLQKGYGLNFYDNRFIQSVYAYRMPGYPLFIAAGGSVHAALFHQ